MDEILERLLFQSNYPKMGAKNHDVCIVRQDDLKAILQLVYEQKAEINTLFSQCSELVGAIYEYANDGTAIMELAEKIDME